MQLLWGDGGSTEAFAQWLEEGRGSRLHAIRDPERRLRCYDLEARPRHTFRTSF